MKQTMRHKLLLGIILLVVIVIGACERPQAPNFKLDHRLQVPLSVDKTYSFLGSSNALIDTTSEEYESLFQVDTDGLVRLSKEEKFSMGDLNDALPEIVVDPSDVETQVGEIELTKFNSEENPSVGATSFEQITGVHPSEVKDEELPAGKSETVTIDFSTDYFVSAVIKEGRLQIVFTNELGFDIHQLELTLRSGNTPLSSRIFNQVTNNSTTTWNVDDLADNTLQDLNVAFVAEWQKQPVEGTPKSLFINEVKGDGLIASEVKAAVQSQNFTSTGSTTVDDSNFKFKKEEHFVELKEGDLSIEIDNDIDIAIDNLVLSFPEIKKNEQSLEMKLKNIPAQRNGGEFFKIKDLSGYKIYAQCNCINYRIRAVTEDMQDAEPPVKTTIHESDKLTATVQLNNLSVQQASGYIEPVDILLNEDISANGQGVDIFNDEEAEITAIDGLSSLSEQISDITFADPLLNMIYETNLGVNTTIYASIAGINKAGKPVFLHSSDRNNEYFVTQSEIPSELKNKGQNLKEGQVIKFKLATPTEGSDVISFDADHTNISEFFSHLPNSIRFIGVARINEEQTEGTVVQPVIFNPYLGIDIPIEFSANNATFRDTIDADLNNLPGKGDKQQLSEAVLTIGYANSLPLGMQLRLSMLDQHNEILTVIGDQEPLMVTGASVNTESGFGEGQGKRDKLQVSLNTEQLKLLNKARFMELEIKLNTPEEQVVKIKAEDTVSFEIKMSVNVTSTVN